MSNHFSLAEDGLSVRLYDVVYPTLFYKDCGYFFYSVDGIPYVYCGDVETVKEVEPTAVDFAHIPLPA